MGNNPNIPNELYYLDDNFSVRSLRKYQLKEILAAHNIPYLSSITRIDLINLFKKNIEARREEILKEYKQREKEKLEQESREEYGRGHRVIHKPIKLEDEEIPVRVPARASKKKIVEETTNKKDSDGFAIPSLPSKKSVPKFNAEDSFASSDEEQYKPKPRQLKLKTVKKPITTKVQPISDEPVAYSAGPSKMKKSKFNPPTFNAEDSFASSDDEHVDHRSQSFIQPVQPEPIRQEEPITNNIDYEEENEEEDDTDYNADGNGSDDEDEEISDVEKEELVALYKDQAVPPEIFISSEYRGGASTRSQKFSAVGESFKLWSGKLAKVLVFLCGIYMVIATIGLGITTYARQKNGYCQTFPKSVKHTSSSSWFSKLLPPSCIPCPDHGTCSGGELMCDTLYERKTPFYNIANMFPIADDCVHNSVLGKYVGKVERKIKTQLAKRQGEAACEYLATHPASETVPTARVLVKDVLANLKTNIEAHLPADKIDEILVIALSAVLEDPKIHYWEVDDQRYLGTDHIQYPFKCQVKRFYNSVSFSTKMYSVLFIFISCIAYGVRKDYRKSMLYKEKINSLVKSTTDQLKEQYDNHTKDPIAHPSPALSVSQIRSSIVDLNDRRTINDWQRVVEKVESHPHIKKSFREVRGDPVEYWELNA